MTRNKKKTPAVKPQNKGKTQRQVPKDTDMGDSYTQTITGITSTLVSAVPSTSSQPDPPHDKSDAILSY